MYSLDTLAHVNKKEELKAYYQNNPFIALIDDDAIKHAPDYSQVNVALLEEISDTERIEEFFVDSSGFGRPDEPALTYPSFVKEIHKLKSVHKTILFGALTGVGQFQVYYSIFKKGKKRAENS